MDQLEAPADVNALYLARGEEVERLRPIMQGDVFRNVEIPGIERGLGLAVVLTHPCSMRTRAGLLRPKLLLGRVIEHQNVPPEKWPDGWYRILPLAHLRSATDSLALDFEQLGTVSTADIVVSDRVAYLTDYGATVLQQRFLHHLSRVVVALAVLYAQAAPNFEEADLLYEWLDALVLDPSAEDEVEHQTAEFNHFLNANDEELRRLLRDVVTRSSVRMRVRVEIRSRGPVA